MLYKKVIGTQFTRCFMFIGTYTSTCTGYMDIGKEVDG